MKMFETICHQPATDTLPAGLRPVTWVVGESGCTNIDIDGYDDYAVITLETEKFGPVTLQYRLNKLEYYAFA